MSIKTLLDPNSINNKTLNLYSNSLNIESLDVKNISIENSIHTGDLEITTGGNLIVNGINYNPTNGLGMDGYVLSINGTDGTTTWVPNMSSNEVTYDSTDPTNNGEITLYSSTTGLMIKQSGVLLNTVINDISNKVNKTGDNMTGILDMSNNDIINIKKYYGEYFFINNALVTNITVAGTYVPINVASFTSGLLSNFTNSSNRLNYIGTITKIFRVQTDLCWYLNLPGTDKGGIAIFKNGVKIMTSEICGWLYDITAQEQPITTSCIISLATNDYLEIEITNFTTSIRDIIVKFFHMNVNEI